MEGILRTGTQLARPNNEARRLFLFNSSELVPTTNDNDAARFIEDDDTLESLLQDDSSLNEIQDDCLTSGGSQDLNVNEQAARVEIAVAAATDDFGAPDNKDTLDSVSRDTQCPSKQVMNLNGDSRTLNESQQHTTLDDSSLSDPSNDECILSLLQQCLQNNPVSALNNHYSKKGFTKGLSNSFDHIQCKVDGKPSSYWRAEFTCPLSGKVFCSGLPSTMTSPALMEATEKAFGEFEIMGSDQVVFLTKKGAKRSAAFCTLHGLSDSATTKMSASLRIPTKKRSCRKYPNWVRELHRMGIKASTLSISYEQELCSYESSDEWNCQPTLLCCLLQMKGPNGDKYTIRGMPRSTKRHALESAVAQAASEITKTAKDTTERANDTNEDDDALEAIERLLSCDSMVDASYAVSVPVWATAPIPSEEDTDALLFVYELEFESESGVSFVKEQTGMDESIAGPLGIVFPKDVQPLPNQDLMYETSDILLQPSNGDETKRITVRLRKRFVVSVNEMVAGNASFSTRMSWMKEFNRTMSNFNVYGHNAASLIRKKRARPKQQEDLPSPSDRSYLFVPLTRDEAGTAAVDWNLLERVASYEFRPYIVEHWSLPVGCLLLLACAIVAHWTFSVRNANLVVDTWTISRGFGTLLAGLLFTKVIRFTIPHEIVMNHFLVHARTSVKVYTARADPDASSSKFVRLWAWIRHGFRLPCQIVTAHNDCDFLMMQGTSPNAAGNCFVYSRGLALLPMPRHYLYLARHQRKFMPLIEREIELAFVSVKLQGISTGQADASAVSTLSLASLLKEATTLAPLPTYQRLEFLGDAVLGFYVSILIMAGNSALCLTYDDIETIFTSSTKNDVLNDAALRIGVNRLLFTNKRAQKWRSHFSGMRFRTNIIMSRYDNIADKVMGDAVESLLGAAHMYDVSCSRGSLGVVCDKSTPATLFEKLQLPFSRQCASVDQVGGMLYDCLNHGYPFEKDAAWQKQLDALAETFDTDQERLNDLDDKLLLLCTILARSADQDWIYPTFENDTAKILLRSAICHDDDPEEADFDEEDNKDALVEGMLRLERFRDILYLVGAYALQFCITADLYNRYPNANECELHMLRARAICDDVLVYIMFKAGFQKAIYGMDDEVTAQFGIKVAQADFNGKAIWNANGGWVLPGGVDEFARRRKRSLCTTPAYPGYAGGRLCGNNMKLREVYTEQQMFAMKAIIGALVLSAGTERMYECIAPLFEEVMLLSAEESLRVYKGSNVK